MIPEQLTIKAIVLALLISVVCIGLDAFNKGQRIPHDDEIRYLRLAKVLDVSGVLGGQAHATTPLQSGVAPDRRFAPLYPMFLAAVSRLDSDARAFIHCQAIKKPSQQSECTASPWTILTLQILLAAIQSVFVLLLAWIVTRSLLIAWLSMAIFIASGYPTDVALHYLTENIALPAFFAFLFCLIYGVTRNSITLCALAGAALGVATLTRPSYEYLLYVTPIALISSYALRGARSATELRVTACLAFFIAGIAVLLPWMMRNVVYFGDRALTSGHANLALSERLAYNSMTVTEWCVAFLYWIPKHGERLVEFLFSPERYRRLSWSLEGSFYQYGGPKVFAETLAAAGSAENHLRYLIYERLLAEPVRHTLISIPLAWRGIWLPRTILLSALGVIFLLPTMISLARQKRIENFLIMFLPMLFMLGLHAFVSVNSARYNLPLLVVYCIVISVTIRNSMHHFSRR